MSSTNYRGGLLDPRSLYWTVLRYYYYFIVPDSIDPFEFYVVSALIQSLFVFINKEHLNNLEEANTAYYTN